MKEINDELISGQPKQCCICRRSKTYIIKTADSPRPHWYQDPYSEGSLICGRCFKRLKRHNYFPPEYDLKEIRQSRINQRFCYDCKKTSPNVQLPWHRHADETGTWLCSTCYARRHYAPKKKFKTREEQYEYLSIKFSGGSNPFFGKRHTDETKRKISIKKTGVPLPDSTRLKMIGRTISQQTCRKLSAALKGRPSPMKGKHHSVESKTRIAYMNVGKTHSDETKKKLSALMKGEKNHMYGKHVAEETKKKISESLLGPKNPSFGKKVSEETRRLISQKNLLEIRKADIRCVRMGTSCKASSFELL
jgi:hypothetical protein